MTEILSNGTPNPSHLAELVKKKRQLQHDLEPQPAKAGPVEGKEVEVNGERFRWNRVPTGQQVWNPDTKKLEPGYYSLRTWFSHHTDGVGAGPGWDGRFGLARLTPAQQQERYGHEFTSEEISAPSGKRNPEGKLEGGMPNDIFYLELEPIEDAGFESR